jgi:hypothetical protein
MFKNSFFNKMKIINLKKLKIISILAYSFLFGSIRAVIMYPDMLYFWYICALAGGILLMIKNRAITNRKYKSKIIFFDVFLIIASDILYFNINLPFFIKDVSFLVAIVIYFSIYFKLLFAHKLMNIEHSIV